jgi:hypothetical protein
MWWMWLRVKSVESCLRGGRLLFEHPPNDRVERRTDLALRQVLCLEARRQGSHPKLLKTVYHPFLAVYTEFYPVEC